MDREGAAASMQDSCYGGASVAGAVIGTFVTTILLLAVAALVYRQWRRHKAKHLVFATCTDIVEDAYAFDNPCFKDATPAVNNKNHDSRPLSMASLASESSPTAKDSAKWSSPWSSFVFTGNSANKSDRRRTLDDSCLGPKATRVSIVGLRSHDFTGLGFNVCGNMREGIFVKDLLHRGPASESGRIHPGDRIASVKISFRNMVYEDALTILSYASPYDVELEVEHGGNGAGSRPATLLKKTVGPSPSRICHPLYRSQSIPELSQAHKTSAKRLFIADPNESVGSNYSTMNSTMKSSKSTPGSHTLERHHHEESKSHNNHHKFGIKVLPALDGTVHRIENQNEHNTNLERRNSRKIEVELADGTDDRRESSSGKSHEGAKRIETENVESRNVASERYQKRENSRPREESRLSNGHDVPDLSSARNVSKESAEAVNIPSEVPAEVHNAAMAARRNRKNSMELLNTVAKSSSVEETSDMKSPQKNKRKAPAPPVVAPADNEIERIVPATSVSVKNEPTKKTENPDDSIESITDYAESLNDYVGKVRDSKFENDLSSIPRRILEEKSSKRRKSETDSDNDSEIHDSFTTIELKPADITIHHRPVQANGEKNDKIVEDDDDDESEDVYRKAASLGDLSKYENKSLATLERAQSLDMADTATKKRKLVTPDDIHESTEDLTKIENMDSFDRRKLKKSNEWGTLEDAIWKKADIDDLEANSRTRKRSSNNGTLERSRSAIEMKLKDENVEEESASSPADSSARLGAGDDETSIELYNLPLSMKLTREFLHTEKMFDPDEDNSLLRIMNNGRIVKSPTPEEMELDFRRATPDISQDEEELDEEPVVREIEIRTTVETGTTSSPMSDEYKAALRFLEEDAKQDIPLNLDKDEKDSPYFGRKEIQEEPVRKVTVSTGCPGCDRNHSRHDNDCMRDDSKKNGGARHGDVVDWQPQQMSEKSSENSKEDEKPAMSAFTIGLTRFEKNIDARPKSNVTPTESRIEKKLLRERGVEPEVFNDSRKVDEDEESYDFGSGITVNSKILTSPSIGDRLNVSNISVSSGENSEDSGLVGESGDYSRQDSDVRPPLPETPVPSSLNNQKLTYITEINVSTSRENSLDGQDRADISTKNKESFKPLRNEISLTANGKTSTPKKPPVPPRRNDASRSFSRESENSEKNVVYVSEYKTSGKDRNENTERVSSIPNSGKSGNKDYENWIYLGDNKDQNPWGSDPSQQQSVTSIVVAGEDQKKVHK